MNWIDIRVIEMVISKFWRVWSVASCKKAGNNDIQKRLHIMLTSAITDACLWHDPCQWSEAEPARSMTRVGIRCIALLGLFFVVVTELNQKDTRLYRTINQPVLFGDPP